MPALDTFICSHTCPDVESDFDAREVHASDPSSAAHRYCAIALPSVFPTNAHEQLIIYMKDDRGRYFNVPVMPHAVAWQPVDKPTQYLP